MPQLLHILAHPTPVHSTTTRITDAFLEAYRQAHPADDIVTLNLYHEPVSFLGETQLAALEKAGVPDDGEMTPEEAAAWGEVHGHLQQFCAADKYLLTAPMWNFSIPAVLKAYIDQIVQAGYTFRYTGPGAAVGLMEGKRMVVISTRGGIYSQPPLLEYEMCNRYLHHVFGFLGIDVIADIVAEGLALVGKHEQETILQPVLQQAREVAATF